MKKGIKVLGIVSLVALTMSGCSINKRKNEIIYDNSKDIHVNGTAETLDFNLILVSKKKIENIELVDCNYETASKTSFKSEVYSNSIEYFKNKKIDDVYYSDYKVSINFKDEGYYKVNGITVLVDGENREMVFDEPLKYKKDDVYMINSEHFEQEAFPIVVCTEDIDADESFEYDLESKIDGIIKEISFSDFFDSSKIVCKLNGHETTLPMKVKKGDTVSLTVNYSDLENKLSDYEYAWCDLVIDYEIGIHRYIGREAIITNYFQPISEKLTKVEKFVKECKD